MSDLGARLALAASVAALLAVAAPLAAQQQPARPTLEQPPADTSCGPDYGLTALKSPVVSKPPCRQPLPSTTTDSAATPGVHRSAPGQNAPLSAKGDSLQRQADSTRPKQ